MVEPSIFLRFPVPRFLRAANLRLRLWYASHTTSTRLTCHPAQSLNVLQFHGTSVLTITAPSTTSTSVLGASVTVSASYSRHFTKSDFLPDLISPLTEMEGG